MEKLTFNENASGNPPGYEKAVLERARKKSDIKKGAVNYGGILIGVMMVLVAILFLTTETHIGAGIDVGKMCRTAMILLWCTYFTYLSCSDSGSRAGLETKTYLDAVSLYNDAKEEIARRGVTSRLSEFCGAYVVSELEETRRAILLEVDISYEVYISKYVGLTHRAVDLIDDLTWRQKQAVKKANRTKPIHLTAGMILPCGHAGGHRNPLGVSPEQKKKIQLFIKLAQGIFMSLFAASVVFEAIQDPSWGTFVTIVIKVSMIVLNGYLGYQFGYENVVIDTVRYMGGQRDLMRQAIEYCESKPIEV